MHQLVEWFINLESNLSSANRNQCNGVTFVVNFTSHFKMLILNHSSNNILYTTDLYPVLHVYMLTFRWLLPDKKKASNTSSVTYLQQSAKRQIVLQIKKYVRFLQFTCDLVRSMPVLFYSRLSHILFFCFHLGISSGPGLNFLLQKATIVSFPFIIQKSPSSFNCI